MKNARIAGVGMVKFSKVGKNEPYRVMASKAIKIALKDAGIDYKYIQQAYASYIYGDSTCGQHALYDVGMTGIPIINVNNNCASGSTALYLARQAVEFGAVDCALAFGFEEMKKDSLSAHWLDRESPLEPIINTLSEISTAPEAPLALRMFGQSGNAYIEKYNVNPNIFGKIAVKARNHTINNPYTLYEKKLTLDEVMHSPSIFEPYMTRYMACPSTCGAAAVVVCSESFAKKHALFNANIEIIAQTIVTDIAGSWTDPMKLVGTEMTAQAASNAYEKSGLGPSDIQVIELHDSFTINEVLTYEGLGLCPEGESEKFICDNDNTYGGKFVINPSGGLMSKGHPIGATGLAQATELTWQLRGSAGNRQVEGAKVALAHNSGLGGATVVSMFRRV